MTRSLLISLVFFTSASLFTALASAQDAEPTSEPCTDDPETCELNEAIDQALGNGFEEHLAETKAREERWLNTEMQIVMAAGKAVYDGFCAHCHGIQGWGEPPLYDSPLLTGDPQALISAFTTGSHRPGAFESNYKQQLPYYWNWQDCHTVRASVATYLQTFSHSGDPITRPVPLDASIRAKYGGEHPDLDGLLFDLPQPPRGDFCSDV